MEKASVVIVVATHKKYKMPQDKIYVPLQVGAEGKKDLGYSRDNKGENISEKNSSYCELTGLYWAWKNLDADYIGLAHYRRHFCVKIKGKDPFENVLNEQELTELLNKYSVVVPRKRKYYIESLESHYAHTHYIEQLNLTRKIIEEKYPEYIKTYDSVLKSTSGYMFNMMIMKKRYVDEYCKWLFDILFELEKVYCEPKLSSFQKRYYGRISEIIFNVWLNYQVQIGNIKKSEVKEIKCIHMEKINWWKKGSSFIKAKFFHKKYEGSF